MNASVTAPVAHHSYQGGWHTLTAHITSSDIATVIAAIVGAGIAAFFAIRAYKKQQADGRRDERAKLYAEALRAVEDYREAPYRILRKDGSREARRDITQHLSEVKSRIRFYSGWLAIHAPETVRMAYETYVRTARDEAGTQMTQAWRARATKRDRDVPLGRALPQPATAAAHGEVLAAMRADLQA